jgi:hypothetical protein
MSVSQYPKHDATLAWARHQLGVYETYSNRGPLQRWNPSGGVDYFQGFDFLAGVGYPWCVSFALAAWSQGGKRPLPYKTAGAYDMFNWAKRNGWARPSRSCIPGDLIIFNIGAGHLAILEKPVGTDGMVHTIDGNSGNRVRRGVRSVNTVRGGVHIPEGAVVPVKPPPEPYWVVTTSVNGKRVVVFSKFATEKTVLGLIPRWISKHKGGITIKKGKVRGA